MLKKRVHSQCSQPSVHPMNSNIRDSLLYSIKTKSLLPEKVRRAAGLIIPMELRNEATPSLGVKDHGCFGPGSEPELRRPAGLLDE